MDTYALDYETYYDKACSIKTRGSLGYFSHPDFDAYMVSVVGDEGTSFVGHPKDFEWDRLKGQRVLSHNASFDETLYLFGVDKGWWPRVDYAEWHCTADLSAYCGHPRALKGAAVDVLGISIDKSTRDNMSGKRWENMTDEFKAEVLEYALKDSEFCLELWEKLSPKWPEHERQVSRMNREIAQRGIPIDIEKLKEQKEQITERLFEVENTIPWINDAPILSRKAFNNECRKMGLEPPASLAMTDEDANEWIRKHGAKYQWVHSVRNYRRINALKRKLESFDYATLSDDRYYGGIMYFGAHTGRFSGSGGNLNLQNLPREELFGTNLRSLIAPKPGNRLVVVDLSQIEVRTLCWLAEDKIALNEIQQSDDIYEAFANRFKVWDSSKGVLKDENPKLRHKVKTMVLGCGYGASPTRFASIAGVDYDEAEYLVNLYQDQMQLVVRYWNLLYRRLRPAHDKFEDYKILLPSGRELNYGAIKSKIVEGRIVFFSKSVVKGSKKTVMSLWGGLLAENAASALARDIFVDIMLRLEAAGLKIIFHVHDEVVIEVKKEDAEETLAKVIATMQTPPTWIPDIPLDAEGKILERYEK
tara:strand:+ start:9701 stop:11464 length:1764 start_codon:yes stop_codon:yes gene_type:complete